MEKSLDLLCLRLSEIEHQLYGNPVHSTVVITSRGEDGDAAQTASLENQSFQNHPANFSQINLLKMIMEIESKLKALTVGKDRFNQCFNELQRLQKWLREEDHMDSLISTFGSPASVIKFEEVLAFEDEIRLDSERIAELERLMPSLDQPHLKQMDQLEPKLIHLKLELMKLQQKSQELDQETKDLVKRANIWYQNLLVKLKQINDDLTEMERKQEQEKYDT